MYGQVEFGINLDWWRTTLQWNWCWM